MQKSAGALHQPFTSDSASTTEAPTPKTAPRLIAMAVSLVGDQSKVMEQMRCSEADFFSYCSGRKELPFPQLHRLISLIVDEQRITIAKHRASLSAIRAKSMRFQP